MWRRSETTGLIMEALHLLHKTVIVLYDLEGGAEMHDSGIVTKTVALWITRAERSRLELVSCPSRLLVDTKSTMMSISQG